MKKILFICTANICRSPIAEAIFNALAEDKGIAFQAESAGVAALKGEPIVPNASAALEEAGIYTKGRRARQVSRAMLEEADLVLAMSPQHVIELRRLFGSLPNNVHTLPEYTANVSGEHEISDPYGHSMAAYRASVRQLLEHIERLLDRLEL